VVGFRPRVPLAPGESVSEAIPGLEGSPAARPSPVAPLQGALQPAALGCLPRGALDVVRAWSGRSVRVALFGSGEAVVTAPELRVDWVPGTTRKAAGVPPRAPTAKAFMSIEYTPEQSFGGGLPPELSGIERRIGRVDAAEAALENGHRGLAAVGVDQEARLVVDHVRAGHREARARGGAGRSREADRGRAAQELVFAVQ
jgi:hypothetical protein